MEWLEDLEVATGSETRVIVKHHKVSYDAKIILHLVRCFVGTVT